jgi:hypothetical protein
MYGAIFVWAENLVLLLISICHNIKGDISIKLIYQHDVFSRLWENRILKYLAKFQILVQVWVITFFWNQNLYIFNIFMAYLI